MNSSIDDITLCQICFNQFGSKECCPRMVSCGHTFCHSCLQRFISEGSVCPTCKNDLNFISADDIPINYAVKSLSETASKTEESLNLIRDTLEAAALLTDCKESLVAMKETRKRELPHDGHCDEHGFPNNFKCLNCNKLLCGICITLMDKKCSNVLPVLEAFNFMKTEMLLKMKVFNNKLENINKILDSKLDHLNRKKEKLYQEIEIVEAEVEDTKSNKERNKKLHEESMRHEKDLNEATCNEHYDTVDAKVKFFLEENFVGILLSASSFPPSPPSCPSFLSPPLPPSPPSCPSPPSLPSSSMPLSLPSAPSLPSCSSVPSPSSSPSPPFRPSRLSHFSPPPRPSRLSVPSPPSRPSRLSRFSPPPRPSRLSGSSPFSSPSPPSPLSLPSPPLILSIKNAMKLTKKDLEKKSFYVMKIDNEEKKFAKMKVKGHLICFDDWEDAVEKGSVCVDFFNFISSRTSVIDTYKFFDEHKNQLHNPKLPKDRFKCSKIEVKERRVYFHSFKIPSRSDLAFEFGSLLKMLGCSSGIPTQVYMIIKGSSGELVIATDGGSPRAINFLLLASGIMDDSYQGTPLFNADSIVEGGLKKKGNYFPGVVEGIQNGGIYKRQLKRGDVQGLNANDQNCLAFFGVWKDDDSYPSTSTTTFGRVKRGMEVIDQINDSDKMKECGFLLDFP